MQAEKLINLLIGPAESLSYKIDADRSRGLTLTANAPPTQTRT